MSVMGFAPISGNAYVESVLVHWAACLALDQLGRRISITISDALAKVGVGGLLRVAFSARFSSIGSRPSLIIIALPQAALRASANGTFGYDPRPKFLLFPLIVTRWIQCLVPDLPPEDRGRLRLNRFPCPGPIERTPRIVRFVCVLKSWRLALPIPVLYLFGGCSRFLPDFTERTNGRALPDLNRARPRLVPIHDVKWRRGRDSNPREVLPPTRFPVAPIRPLWHLSAVVRTFGTFLDHAGF